MGTAEAAAKLSARDQAILGEKLLEQGKLKRDDVITLRHVRLEAAAAELPDDMFTLAQQPWETQAYNALEGALRVIPQGADEALRTDLQAMLERLSRPIDQPELL
jgi:hypothetical protein